MNGKSGIHALFLTSLTILIAQSTNYDIHILLPAQSTSFSTPAVEMTRKFTKAEMLITQGAEQIGTKFQRLYLYFQGRQPTNSRPTIVDIRSRRKNKMVATKPKVLVSHFL
jgi:hypothetical protein